MHAFYHIFTDRARKSLEIATDLALDRKHVSLNNSHVLFGLCAEGKNVAVQILKNLKIDVDSLRMSVSNNLTRGTYYNHRNIVPYGKDTCITICKAIDYGYQINHVGCHHLLLGLLEDLENP